MGREYVPPKLDRTPLEMRRLIDFALMRVGVGGPRYGTRLPARWVDPAYIRSRRDVGRYEQGRSRTIPVPALLELEEDYRQPGFHEYLGWNKEYRRAKRTNAGLWLPA